MAKELLAMRALKEDYVSMGLDIESTCKKTDMLLKIYRKVSWSTKERFDDLNEITYANCMNNSEYLCYLLTFAPDKELDVFEISIFIPLRGIHRAYYQRSVWTARLHQQEISVISKNRRLQVNQ